MSSLELSLSDPSRPNPQRTIAWILGGVILAASLGLSLFGWRQSVLFILGCLFGLSLYHASFGFASAYRQMWLRGETKGVLAQILMLAIATLLFIPVLIQGSFFGQDIRGAVAPVALQGAIGAFLFGVGMQLGSGCACGTLYTIGGGSTMMVFTLLAFTVGSFWASITGQWWENLPKLPPISLVKTWGWGGGLLQLLILGTIAFFLWRWQQTKSLTVPNISETDLPKPTSRWKSFLYGPWSVAIGAIALAVLNWLTLLVAGRPWGVTWAFTLWGAKVAQLLGWNPATSPFWNQGMGAAALNQSLFADMTSVMNLGVILGAAGAAALAGRFTLKKPPSRIAVGAALIGGLLMGYGARLAYGCNVGAYFGGIASTSLHGWLWITFALLGTGLGVKLRSRIIP